MKTLNRCLFAALTDEDRSLPLYATGAGGWVHQEAVDRPQGYPDYQWIQCLAGEGRLTVRGTTATVSTGQGMLLFPDEPHRYEPVREPWTVRWVTFKGPLAAAFTAQLGFSRTAVLSVSSPEQTLSRVDAVVELIESGRPDAAPAASAAVYGLLVDLRSLAAHPHREPRSKRDWQNALAPALDYAERHFAEPVTLADLAARIGRSAQYTCLLFRRATGMRPIEYVTGIRMRRAKEWLLDCPDMPVAEVARRVGYEHPGYFIRVFRKREGMTPGAFRRLHRSSTGPAETSPQDPP